MVPCPAHQHTVTCSMVLERCTSTTDLVDVLPLVFQHSSISSAVGPLCSLLCTSQQAAQAVEQHCIGKVHLRAERPAGLHWFGKHWRLVHSLEAETGFMHVPTLEAFAEGLAAAAAAAAAAAGAARCAGAGAAGAAQVDCNAVQLRSVKAVTCPHAALSHLQAFTTLTSLSFEDLSEDLSDIPAKVDPCAALAGLTSLRCLSISTAAGSLLPGTSSLTNLTSLTAGQLTEEGVKLLRHLPAQLQALTMTIVGYGANPSYIDLSHVTGLTRFIATSARKDSDPGYGLIVATSYSRLGQYVSPKLPPNCRHLSVTDVYTAQPLLELQQLERLEIDRYFPAAGSQSALQQLSSLSSLNDLQINIKASDVTAGALQDLPALRGLRLRHTGKGDAADRVTAIGSSVLRQLAQLSALQRLSMQEVMLLNSTHCKVAEVFGSLCGLHSLWLSGCVVEGNCDGSYRGGCSSAQFAGIVGAIAGLPELRDLRLVRLSQWDEAASAALAAATQLTGLLVSGHWQDDCVSLVGQMHKLVGLRSLWVNSAKVECSDLAAAASSLVGLTELCWGLRTCDPQQLSTLFPGAALGRVKSMDLALVDDPCDKAVWGVQWWSPADGDWV